MWKSYECANNWEIFELVTRTEDNEIGVQESNQFLLNAMEVHILLMMHMGDASAVGTMDKAAMGYYIVKWLSKPYTLQVETEGMARMIGTGILMVKGVYYNRVEHTTYWYMLAGVRTVFEMRHVLWTGLQLLEICSKNKLPQAWNRMEATRQKTAKVASFKHDRIIEGAGRTTTTRRVTS